MKMFGVTHFTVAQSKSHSDMDTSPKGLSVLNLSIFSRPTPLCKVYGYNSSYQVFTLA